MGYKDAIEAAGASVIEFERFGSYQGDWWAKTNLGWIHGSYGSCSGCDAFEGEFGYGCENCEEHQYSSKYECKGCSECEKSAAEYKRRLADFGRGYLDGAMTHAKALEVASENLEWDLEAEEMVKFIKEHE